MDARTLKRKADAVAKAYEARDAAIREAHNEGWSLRDIAEAVGLHFTSVRKIVNQRRTPAPER